MATTPLLDLAKSGALLKMIREMSDSELDQIRQALRGSTNKRERKVSKRTMSEAGKKALVAAQKKRWARMIAEQKKRAKKRKTAAPKKSE